MLKFSIEKTVCEIDDDYKIKTSGKLAKEIEKLWNAILGLSSPSFPCPIDEMESIARSVGAKIEKYEQEAKEGTIY